MSPLRPRTSAPCSRTASRILSQTYHDSKIDYFPIVAGEHDLDDVLSNVMDVSLTVAIHHGALLVRACALLFRLP